MHVKYKLGQLLPLHSYHLQIYTHRYPAVSTGNNDYYYKCNASLMAILVMLAVVVVVVLVNLCMCKCVLESKWETVRNINNKQCNTKTMIVKV